MSKKYSRLFSAIICIALIICISFSVLRKLFPVPYQKVIDEYCKKYSVDKWFVTALIKAESNFNEDAVSHAGAKGIMQVTDETFSFCRENTDIKTPDIFSPDANIHAGVWYLSYLIKKYDGNTQNALAAYNAGMGNVDKWLKDTRYSSDGKTLKEIPFSETVRYTEKINRYKIIYNILY